VNSPVGYMMIGVGRLLPLVPAFGPLLMVVGVGVVPENRSPRPRGSEVVDLDITRNTAAAVKNINK
jgi:hypothetical protein